MFEDVFWIFVVDDDFDVVLFVKIVFQWRVGCVVDVVEDGEVVVECVVVFWFDVVVIDIEMLGLNGLELFVELCWIVLIVLVIVMIVYVFVEYVVLVLWVQVDEFLMKLFDNVKFVEVVMWLVVEGWCCWDEVRILEWVFVIGVYFDDVEIGVGGLFVVYVKVGDEIIIFMLLCGVCGGDVDSCQDELLVFVEMFGVCFFFKDFIDIEILGGGFIVCLIEEVVQEIQFMIVYMYLSYDCYQDY